MNKQERELDATEEAILPRLAPIPGLEMEPDLLGPELRAEVANAADVLDRVRSRAWVNARRVVL